MLVPNGVEFAATALAILLLGGQPLLIELGLGDAVFLSRVRAAAPRWIFVHPLVQRINRIPFARALLRKREIDVPPVPEAGPGVRRLRIDAKLLDALAAKTDADAIARFRPTPRDARDDGILIFTGGTTDLPKGVRISHGAIDDYLSHIACAIEGLTVEHLLADTPQQVLFALRLGKTAYVTKGRKQRRAAHVLSLVRRGVIDAYFGSPYVWMEMMAQAGADRARLPDSLKTVLLGGAPVTPEFVARLREWLAPSTRAMVLYGMTEAGPVCAAHAQDKIEYDGEGDLVGAPLGRVRLEIRDADESTGIGEVVVHSPSLYSGYLGREERAEGEGLRTGDLGRFVTVRDQQMLALMGRAKDMIIRNSVNLYPTSFEANIRAFEDRGERVVRECALIGLWNAERQDEDVVCCVEFHGGVESSIDRLRPWVEKVCGTDGKPDHYVVLDSIPVTGRQNKVDKKALRKTCAQRLGYDAASPIEAREGAGA